MYQYEQIVEMARRARTGAEVYDMLEGFCRNHGFDNFSLLVTHSPPDKHSPETGGLLYCNYPDEWKKRYFQNKYYTTDPVVAHCTKSILPLDWSFVESSPRLSSEASRVMLEARDYGLRSGSSVSVRGFRGQLGMLSVTSRDESSTAVSTRFHDLIPIAQILMCHLVEELNDRLPISRAEAKQNPLSDREKECLRWAAAGKTAWEIGNILGISERTVVFHTNNAAKKLDAVNRTHAVARALHLSLISL